MSVFRFLWERFYGWVQRHPPKSFNIYLGKFAYTPRLIGVRPLDNGRLALAYRNELKSGSASVELYIYDVLADFAHRTDRECFRRWWNPEFFKTVYMYDYDICWGVGDDLDLFADSVYYSKNLVRVNDEEVYFSCIS